MSFSVSLFLVSFLLPAGLAVTVAVIFRLLFDKRRLLAGAALGLAVGFGVADQVTRGFVGWWPSDLSRRLPWWAALAVLAVIVEDGAGMRRSKRAQLVLVQGARLIACAAAVFCFIRVFRESSDLSLAWWCVAGTLLTVLLVSEWALLRRLVDGDGIWSTLSLAAVACSAGAVIALSGWPSLARACAALGACLAALVTLAWIWNQSRLTAGMVGGFLLLYNSLVGCAHWFGPLSGFAAGLLTIAPLLGWAGRVPWFALQLRIAPAMQALCPLALILTAAILVRHDAAVPLPPDDRLPDFPDRSYCYIAFAEDQRIAVYEVQPTSGELNHVGDTLTKGKPNTLVIDPRGRFLFASLHASNQLASYRIDWSTGKLAHVSTVPDDSEPAYLSTDQDGRFLLCAGFARGMVSVYSIGPDGGLSQKPTQTIETVRGAHAVLLDPQERFAFVPHIQPAHAIFQFNYDALTGRLEPASVPRLATPAGTGPRHPIFHPCKDVLYIVNESGSVTVYQLDRAIGTLRPIQTISTLPHDYQGPVAAADLCLHPSRRFMYVSNRWHASIAVFSVDPTDGQLAPVGHTVTEQRPRSISLDPRGHFLYVAGSTWDRVAIYRVDPTSGRLKHTGIRELGRGPVWVTVARRPSIRP